MRRRRRTASCDCPARGRALTTAEPARGANGGASLVVNVDGGARGNPGPAAVAAVVTTPDGELVAERGRSIGRATNNVAEYRALLLGIELAREHGASKVELIGDSELIVRQVTGAYKVKNAELKPLHRQVLRALDGFDAWSIRHVRREHNAAADKLVNETLDL